MHESIRDSNGRERQRTPHDGGSYDDRQIRGRVAPKQKPGRSRQDYRTQPEFLSAVLSRLGISAFVADVAASAENTVAEEFFDKEADALTRDWPLGGWNWLNPEFRHIEPWVKGAYRRSRHGVRTAVLVPAGVGANWWAKWVHGKAFVLLLNGRLRFVGEKDFYPKDCALLLYGPDIAPGYEVWTWQQKTEKPEALLTRSLEMLTKQLDEHT